MSVKKIMISCQVSWFYNGCLALASELTPLISALFIVVLFSSVLLRPWQAGALGNPVHCSLQCTVNSKLYFQMTTWVIFLVGFESNCFPGAQCKYQQQIIPTTFFFFCMPKMATHFKEQLAHFHTSHPSRAKASRESKMWSSILTHCLRAWFLLLKYKMSFFLIAWFLRGENRGQKDGNKRIRWEHVRGIQSLSDTALAFIIFLSHNGAKPMMSSRSSGTFSIISGASVRHFFSQYKNNHINTHSLSDSHTLT